MVKSFCLNGTFGFIIELFYYHLYYHKVVIEREEGMRQQVSYYLLVSLVTWTKVYLSLFLMKQCCYFSLFSQDCFSTLITFIVLPQSLSAFTLKTHFLMTGINFYTHLKRSLLCSNYIKENQLLFSTIQVFIHF